MFFTANSTDISQQKYQMKFADKHPIVFVFLKYVTTFLYILRS